MEIYENLLTLPINKNEYYIRKYVKFITSRITDTSNNSHLHHILPKAVDFFPEYKNLTTNKWNGILLSAREHFIAHKLLHMAFSGSSQTFAFYMMSNEYHITNSKIYADSKKLHIQKLIEMTQCPIRNSKISNALKGRPRTENQIKAATGKRPQWHGDNISKGLLNSDKRYWKHDSERLQKHINQLKLRKRNPLSNEQKKNISNSKLHHVYKTPFGIFNSPKDIAISLGHPEQDLTRIFSRLDKTPRKKLLSLFNLENKNGLTWKEIGFDLLPK